MVDYNLIEEIGIEEGEVDGLIREALGEQVADGDMDGLLQENIQDSAASYFWSGNAFFQLGMQEMDLADGFPFYHRAQDQYRKALEKDDGQRWNIKFNYELIRTALEQAEQTEEEQEFKVLRPKDQIRQADTKVAG